MSMNEAAIQINFKTKKDGMLINLRANDAIELDGLLDSLTQRLAALIDLEQTVETMAAPAQSQAILVQLFTQDTMLLAQMRQHHTLPHSPAWTPSKDLILLFLYKILETSACHLPDRTTATGAAIMAQLLKMCTPEQYTLLTRAWPIQQVVQAAQDTQQMSLPAVVC